MAHHARNMDLETNLLHFLINSLIRCHTVGSFNKPLNCGLCMVSLEEPGRVESCPFVEHGSGVKVTSSIIKPHLSPLSADKAKMVTDCYLCSIYLNIVKIYLLYRLVGMSMYTFLCVTPPFQHMLGV